MALRTNTINGDTGSQPLVDVSDHAVGHLSIVGNVEVIIVDVELGVGISGAGSAESNSNKVLTKNSAEDTVTEVTVLSEDLVDDIPLKDLALVAGDHGRNVVLNDRGEGGAVVDVLNPLRQLGVPEESVATDELVVRNGEVNDLVGIGEGEGVSRSYSSSDLHYFFLVNVTLRSMASHFMLFSHVTWPNWALTMLIKAVLLRW